MVNDHNSQGETRPDHRHLHLYGGRRQVARHAPLARPRRADPALPPHRHIPAPAGRAVRPLPAPRGVQAHLVDRLRRRDDKHLHSAPVPCRPADRVGRARPGPVVPPDLVLAALVVQAGPAVRVVRVAPAVGSRPASPARISRPSRRPHRDRYRQHDGAAAA
ncbi:hypothetical protein GCM10025762_44460 [Haloechinothrix salitolerans]